jgi:hypothetical protein
MTYKPLLQPSSKVDFSNLPASIDWLDEDGISYSVSKEKTNKIPIRIKANRKVINAWEIKKLAVLNDVTHITPGRHHLYDTISGGLPIFVIRLALISNSPLGLMVAKLFSFIKRHPYPVREFKSDVAAHAWLKEYSNINANAR